MKNDTLSLHAACREFPHIITTKNHEKTKQLIK